MKNQIKDINVYNKECPLLAPMAEEGWIDNEIASLTIKEYLKDFPKLDALILGCTHYPLFKKIIEREMPNTEIINTGEKIAKYIKSNIDLSDNKQRAKDAIYLTDTECNFINVSHKLLNENIEIMKGNV